MSRHPIRLLAPAVSSTVVASFCVGLAFFASPRHADSFVLVGGVGALFFGYRALVEVRQVWQQFAAQLEHRRAMRRAAPLTRINLRKDDIR